MEGILPLLKPPGMTSSDVVVRVRRLLGGVKTGHLGTLDPAAAGVLPLLLGPATRLAPYVADEPKEYLAEVQLGIATDSGDATGRPMREAPLPPLDPVFLQESLQPFVGEILQVPPMASAVKVGGRRLYEHFRRGETVNRPARTVQVHGIELLETVPGGLVRLRILCGKGTYIRTLAEDWAAHIGSAAHLRFLLRTRVGIFPLERAITLDEIRQGQAASALVSSAAALAHLPAMEVSPADVAMVRVGRFPPLPPLAGVFTLVDRQGRLLAVARMEEGSPRYLRGMASEGGENGP